jgi:hypothetical protein
MSFNEMNQTELTVGCFRLVADRLEHEKKTGSGATVSLAMIHFMTQWQEDLLSYEFRTVRGYVKSIFLALEQGRVTWRDTEKLAAIHARALETGTQLNTAVQTTRQTGQQKSQQASGSTSSQKKRYCTDFNQGICENKSNSHYSDQGWVQHICAFCFNKKGKTFPHPEVECNQKSGNFPNQNSGSRSQPINPKN